MTQQRPASPLFVSVLLTCLCLGLGGGLRSASAGEKAATPIRMACVGDSITQGVHVRGEDNYTAVLGRLLGERYADGVHPNAAGCAVLAQAVFQALAPADAADVARRAAAAEAKATQANLEGWELGPFIKHPEPVLRAEHLYSFRAGR